MNKPLVSVIIPTYNGRKYIAKAIGSVLNQTFKALEIIIIDDGSTDGSDKVVFELIKKKPSIIAIKNKTNLGFVKTLNKGITAARGKYIARLDDDDFWHNPQKLEKQIGFLEGNPEYILTGGGLIKIDDKGKEIIRYLFPEKDEEIRKTILIDNLFAHSSVVFKKDAFLQVGGYDEQFGFFADRELWLKLGKIGKFYNFPEYFIYYLDKENDKSNYNSRNNYIRRKLKLNIKLRKKYRYDYPGFYKSFLLCIASYVYSFLPYRPKFWWIIFKIRILLVGPPSYKYLKPSFKNKNEHF